LGPLAERAATFPGGSQNRREGQVVGRADREPRIRDRDSAHTRMTCSLCGGILSEAGDLDSLLRCPMRTLPVYLLSALGLLAMVAGVNRAAEPATSSAPKPLPEAVVKAWTGAGAEVGWISDDPDKRLDFREGDKGQAGEIPGFSFRKLTPGLIAKLPAPDTPFGLYLYRRELTDDLVKELAGLKNLQALNLDWNQEVTDEGVKALAGMKNLRMLSLSDTKMTDAGVKELTRLKNLRSFDLSGTQVTDDGMMDIASIKGLQTLNLGHTKVSDAGVKEVASLQDLRALRLSNTKVTLAGVKELAELKNLQKLDLGFNKKLCQNR